MWRFNCWFAGVHLIAITAFGAWNTEKGREDHMAGLGDFTLGALLDPSFEPDDFYESFQAPKFHDFTAPEEPIDPDAFFMVQPGMVTKMAVAMEDVKMMAPNILKDVPKTAQGSLEQVAPKIPGIAEKTVWSSKNPCSAMLSLAMSNLKLLSSLSPFCTCWSPGLLREF